MWEYAVTRQMCLEYVEYAANTPNATLICSNMQNMLRLTWSHVCEYIIGAREHFEITKSNPLDNNGS